MIVTCPACATRYLVDPRALGATGRQVRCTQCNHIWPQPPAEDAPRRVDLALPAARAARRWGWSPAVITRGLFVLLGLWSVGAGSR